jgi:uncharacterized protein involved in exopolysaccharide biosynthesis
VGQARDQLDTLITALKQRFEGIEDLLKSDRLQQDSRTLQAELEDIQTLRHELTATRDREWDAYQTLARKLDEAAIANNLSDAEIRLATSAVPSRRPIRPNTVVTVIAALILGALVSAIGVFVIETLEKRATYRPPLPSVP